jgi:transcriptional regulator with XRE-family HTH domain
MDNGKRLKSDLKKKKLSMMKCARLLGVADMTVWRYTSGDREPSEEIRKKLKQKLGFTWEDN